MRHDSVLGALLGALALGMHCGTAAAQAPSATKVADAKPGDVRVMVTAAYRVPLDAVLAQAQQAIGHPLVVEYGSARGNLKDEILAGQEFEVAILLPDVDAELRKQGKIVPKSQVVALDPAGIALRGDAALPDVSTPAALKSALLNAKSVKYGPTGAALDTVNRVLGTLGIADAIKDTSHAKGTVELAAGEYELQFGPISEIIPNKSVHNLGPVIAPLQVPAVIEATVGTHASDPKAARALIKFLQGPAVAAALKDDGMLRGDGKTP